MIYVQSSRHTIQRPPDVFMAPPRVIQEILRVTTQERKIRNDKRRFDPVHRSKHRVGVASCTDPGRNVIAKLL